MRKPYKTDLADARWTIIEPLIPPARPGGRPRTTDIREVLNTLLYQARTGCQWELLPHDLLPKSTAWDYFAQWRDDGTWQRIVDALRPQVREAEGREPTPWVGSIDSQTTKGTEVGGERGFDGGKLVRDRLAGLALQAAEQATDDQRGRRFRRAYRFRAGIEGRAGKPGGAGPGAVRPGRDRGVEPPGIPRPTCRISHQ